MKITKWVDMGQEVEIEIGADDIRAAFAQSPAAPSGVEQRAKLVLQELRAIEFEELTDREREERKVQMLVRLASSPAAQTPEVLTQIPVRKQCSCGDPRCNYDNYWSKKHAREARSGAQTEPSPAQTKEK